MKEKIIEFETSKLAKDKGFDIPVLQYYWGNNGIKEFEISMYAGDEWIQLTASSFEDNWNDGWTVNKEGEKCSNPSETKNYLITSSAPTQSLLQKWLREKHNIIVIIEQNIDDDTYCVKINKVKCESDYLTYEEALEKGLLEGLKNL